MSGVLFNIRGSRSLLVAVNISLTCLRWVIRHACSALKYAPLMKLCS